MYGQGSYGPQAGQGPYRLHHLPTALPPPASSRSPAAWNSVMHRPPAAVPSQINQQIPRGPPFQGPPAGMANITNPSHASLPQPPPALGRMPMTGPYCNSQHNLHYPLHVGTQNSHHFPTPSPLPPPPPRPPPVQGHPTHWHPVNSQPKQPISVQGRPIPNAPPPPPLPPPPLSQPPRPHASSSPVAPSPPFCRPLLLASSVFNISSSTLALDVSGQRNDKVVASEGRTVESLGRRCGLISALDRSMALEIDVHPAPRKPADEKIMKRIETLCQFIAKNGPGFEDMVRTRESANPEFKFLFGGEPGSDAAVAHEYYQWAKKKYTFGDKLHEGALNLRPSENGISVQTKPFIVTSVVHPSSDSDIEMEDDITQVDMDQEMERSVEYYCQDSDLVRYDHDGKEPPMPQIVQCASTQYVSCDKVPFSEVPGWSDYGHQVQVDEFGRPVRKGASDSDPDDSLHAGRQHHKERESSRSRRQSPVGRRNGRRRSLPWVIDRRNRSALENSTAQPCNETIPLPEKKYSKRKKRREKRLKRKEARNISGGVAYAVLQEIRKKRKKKRIKRRAQEGEAKAREKVSGKSNLLSDIPDNVLRVADLDESVTKEFSSTFGKQSDIEREEVHGEAHTKETCFHSDDARISHLSDGKPEQVEERIQATSAQAPMGIFDFFLCLSRI